MKLVYFIFVYIFRRARFFGESLSFLIAMLPHSLATVVID